MKWNARQQKKRKANEQVIVAIEHLVMPLHLSFTVKRTRTWLTEDKTAQRQLITYQGDWNVMFFKEIGCPNLGMAVAKPSQSQMKPDVAIRPGADTALNWDDDAMGWLLADTDYTSTLTKQQLKDLKNGIEMNLITHLL